MGDVAVNMNSVLAVHGKDAAIPPAGDAPDGATDKKTQTV